MVRLSKSLAVRATRALRVGLGGRDQPQMNKVNMYVPGFDKESLKHNWSVGIDVSFVDMHGGWGMIFNDRFFLS